MSSSTHPDGPLPGAGRGRILIAVRPPRRRRPPSLRSPRSRVPARARPPRRRAAAPRSRSSTTRTRAASSTAASRPPSTRRASPTALVSIVTYHWNNGRGATPGTVGVQSATMSPHPRPRAAEPGKGASSTTSSLPTGTCTEPEGRDPERDVLVHGLRPEDVVAEPRLGREGLLHRLRDARRARAPGWKRHNPHGQDQREHEGRRDHYQRRRRDQERQVEPSSR